MTKTYDETLQAFIGTTYKLQRPFLWGDMTAATDGATLMRVPSRLCTQTYEKGYEGITSDPTFSDYSTNYKPLPKKFKTKDLRITDPKLLDIVHRAACVGCIELENHKCNCNYCRVDDAECDICEDMEIAEMVVYVEFLGRQFNYKYLDYVFTAIDTHAKGEFTVLEHTDESKASPILILASEMEFWVMPSRGTYKSVQILGEK